jgi:hypothetical protein
MASAKFSIELESVLLWLEVLEPVVPLIKEAELISRCDACV